VILLDTNVVSELMKARPALGVERWFLHHEEDLVLSVIVLAELAYGIRKLDAGGRRDALASQLQAWRQRYGSRCLAFGVVAAELYGEIMASARRSRRPMSVPDGQLAAQAREHGATLATRNLSDFQFSGVRVVNPWG
jgi:predicted nucleic acid-binding protein